MSQSLLADALAAGATVVTPNNRLAREVVLRFDTLRLAEGRRAWTAAQALPWTMWLDRLWLSALAARAANGRVLLDPGAARELWHILIAADRPGLMDSRGAARHAANAWATFHAWRNAGDSLQRMEAFGANDDALLFARWAGRYAHRLDALGAIDRAELPDVLASCAISAWGRPLGRVVLFGFVALTPQQRRLLAALRGAGVPLDEMPAVAEPEPLQRRTACATPSGELAQALAFARDRLEADPGRRIAIVVADLEQRRDEAIALAEEILSAEQLLALLPDAERPYGISLGDRLASVPMVACALDLIALSFGEIDATAAASVVRSPFLPDASAQWKFRAELERIWREEGRRHVGWADVVSGLRRVDPSLHQRVLALQPSMRGSRLPRDWARAWSDWLAALGWPGSAPLTSAQWQARDAWSNALATFAASGMITGARTAAAAAGALSALLEETVWAPETPPAAIQILGILEAAGLAFDCAWLAGFDAGRWPPAAAPDAFLPLGWQQARGVTRANAETALVGARELTAQLGAMASEVIVSHAEQIDDAPATVSPLFAGWQAIDVGRLPRVVRLAAAVPAVPMERCVDDTAPSLAPGTSIRGGAQLFESQSACPFQAFARFRLRGDAWTECPEGLSALERGSVLHAVLKAFWDDVKDHATLVGLDDAALTRSVAAAVELGKGKLAPARWRALPPAVAQAESHRLAATLRGWVDEVERKRPPFCVRSHEESIECALEGIAVRARIDRIDELQGGGVAIIDYKSGRIVKPVRWFDPRPEGVQLAVYAHGFAAHDATPVRALAYAQVRAGEIIVGGLAEAPALWPELDVPGGNRSRVPARGWADARERMEAGLAVLAGEIRSGRADVTPRGRTACQYCRLKPLCRIRLLDDPEDFARSTTVDE